MEQTSQSLGLVWDSEAGTVTSPDGSGQQTLREVDLCELSAEVEAWRSDPIEGDREAESDWACLAQCVRDAQHSLMDPSINITDVADWRELVEAEHGSNPVRAAAVQLCVDPAEGLARLETVHRLHGTPMSEHLGRVLVYPVLTRGGPVDGPGLVRALRSEHAQGLLSRICAGHSVDWDGAFDVRNDVGRLDDDAAAASDALRDWCEDVVALGGDNAGLWAAADWLQPDSTADLGISAETTDAELDGIEADIDATAAGEYAVLSGTREYLEDLRESLQEEDHDDI